MPRKKSSVPVPRLHRPSGRARVYVNGTYIYLGPWGSQEADKEYRRIIAEMVVESPGIRPDVTVSELVALFLEWAKEYYVKPSGRSTGSFERYVLAVRPLIDLFEWDKLTAQSFLCGVAADRIAAALHEPPDRVGRVTT